MLSFHAVGKGNIEVAMEGKTVPSGINWIDAVRPDAREIAFLERTLGMLTMEGSQMTASMFRDIKAGAPVEADHIVGDMIARGDAAKVPVPRLRTAYTHLKAYEKQRG